MPPMYFDRVWVSWVWVWVVLVGGIQAFNLSPAHHSLLEGPKDSQFGFSVAFWEDAEGDRRVVVGAPRGRNSTVGRGELPLGNVYYCQVIGAGSGQCVADVRIPVLNNEVHSLAALGDNYTMSGQGIGVGHSLATNKHHGSSTLAVCSPRYPRMVDLTVENRGACFILNTPTSQPDTIVFNSRTIPKSKTLQDAMMGFSVALWETDNLVVGGPMAFLGEGIVQRNVLNSRIENKNRFMATNLTVTPKPDPVCTYEGWAVTVGRFSHSENPSIAASTINYGNITGKVSFYPIAMIAHDPPLLSLYGNEIGAGFGYSLGSADVDGDGISDLLVGSPLATNLDLEILDAGMVFVYLAPLLQDRNGLAPQKLKGSYPFGRFGLSLTSLGDLNRDGYDDVAVAAPYAGLDKGGVIYIYNGGPSGLIAHQPQILEALEHFPGLRGFGTSLDGGLDVDDNGYPDLVVGAADSNMAVYIRSTPVVRLVGGVYFAAPNVMAEDSACEIEAAGYRKFRAVCFTLTFNLTYDSYRKIDGLTLRFHMKLEGKEDTSQFGFKLNNDPSYTLTRTVNYHDRSSPWSLKAFAKRDRSNIGLTLRATVTVSVAPPSSSFSGGFGPSAPREPKTSDRASLLQPLLERFAPHAPTTFVTSTTLVCQDNNTCFSQPDMVLTATGPLVTVGEGPLGIEVTLEVRDDPAYMVKVQVSHPEVLGFTRVHVQGEGLIPECGYKVLVGQSYTNLVCTLPSLQADSKIVFSLLFNYSSVDLLYEAEKRTPPSLPLNLGVTSDTEGDTNPANNRVFLKLNVGTSSILYTKADAQPETQTVVVNETATKEELDQASLPPHNPLPVNRLGPYLTHHFSLYNRGPTPVLSAKLVFQLPLFLGSELATYFMEQPRTIGPVTCSNITTNPYGLQPPRVSRRSTDSLISTTTSSTSIINTSTTPDTLTVTEANMALHRERRDAISPSESWTTEPQAEMMTTFDPRHPALLERIQSKDGNNQAVECFRPECTVTCEVGLLQEDESVQVYFSSYLVMATVSKVRNKTASVLTWVEAEVAQDGSTIINPRASAVSYIAMIKPKKRGFYSIPLWILLLAIICSIVLFLLIILLLYKAGFFKRNRPPTTSGTRQSLLPPSDHNGEYIGDPLQFQEKVTETEDDEGKEKDNGVPT